MYCTGDGNRGEGKRVIKLFNNMTASKREKPAYGDTAYKLDFTNKILFDNIKYIENNGNL